MGTCPTLEGCRYAIRGAVETLTKGMDRDDARRRMVQGLYRT